MGEDAADLGADIGLPSARERVPTPARVARRRLPVWAIGLGALGLGWVLGVVLSTSPQSLPETPPAQPVAEQTNTEPDDARPDGLVDVGLTTVVLVQAPLRGVAIPTELVVIDGAGPTAIVSDTEVAGATQQVIGQADQRLLVVDDLVVFMAVNDVMVFDPQGKTEPQKVAEAIYLMPGSASGRVWGVTSGSDTVLDIDIRSEQVLDEFDLSAFGKPVGSFAGGLVLTPANPSFGPFALWSPRRGIEPAPLDAEDLEFLDAAGNIVAVHTAEGIASYDTVTGTTRQTDTVLAPRTRHRTLLSPDGARLAVVERGSVTELPQVTVIDLATGVVIDEFGTSYEWQLQWVSPTDLLFIEGALTDIRVKLRTTTDSTTTPVVPLDGPHYWVTTLQP